MRSSLKSFTMLFAICWSTSEPPIFPVYGCRYSRIPSAFIPVALPVGAIGYWPVPYITILLFLLASGGEESILPGVCWLGLGCHSPSITFICLPPVPFFCFSWIYSYFMACTVVLFLIRVNISYVTCTTVYTQHIVHPNRVILKALVARDRASAYTPEKQLPPSCVRMLLSTSPHSD